MKKIIFALVLLLSIAGLAQTDKQKELEERKAKIKAEIEAYQQLLQKEKKKEKSVLNDIKNKSTQIILTERLLKNTEKQTQVLDSDIVSNQKQINLLNTELEFLKADYAKILQSAYKSRSEHSRIMFILSSENFHQAYKRIQYMKQYATYRKMQGDEIKQKQTEIQQAIAKLQGKKQEKQKVLSQTEKEKKQLEKQKQEQEKLVKTIQKDKKKILADITKKQQETRAIDKQIDKIIREAIAEANRKKAEAARIAAEKAERERIERNKKEGKKETRKDPVIVKPAEPVSSTSFDLTPEDKALANDFKTNRGRLPWPVEKGFVSQKHGDQPHPVHKNIVIHNSGIELTAESGSNARAVFEGEVMQIQVITANNKAVYIQHGNYVTVYLNLSQVYVTKGSKVSAKQSIGKIHTSSSGKAIMKFMIYQNANILNPESWLYNM